MKRIFLFCILLMIGFISDAQSISKAHFRLSGSTHQIRSADITVGNVSLEVSGDGEILGYHCLPGGEVTYYDGFGNFDREGKIKSIAGVTIDYYDRFGQASNIGKLKSIGNVEFTYYDVFDDNDQLGKLKQVGSLSITYYTKFDASELLGKLKTAGPVSVQYFDRFDGNRRGIKSIQGNTREVYVSGR